MSNYRAIRTVLALLGPCLCFATPGSAQSTNVVPAYAAVFEGNRSSYRAIPLAGGERLQQVWVGSSIANSSAMLTGIAFRRDAASTDPLPAWPTLPRVVVRLSHTSVDPLTMTGDLNANITGPQTTVYDGPLALPPLPASPTTPAAFAIRIPFQSSFSFQRSSGNLLMDVEFFPVRIPGGGGFASIPYYPIDGVGWQGGEWYSFGSSGDLSGGDAPGIGISTPLERVVFGSEYQLRVVTSNQPGSTIAWLGLSNRRARGLALPVDLSTIGASGSLLTSIDAVFPPATSVNVWPLPPPLSRWEATIPVIVPVTPIFVGITIYHQALVIDPAANALGFATTQAIALGLGPSIGSPETRALVTLGPLGAPIGLPVSNDPLSGPVVEFSGTFQ